MPAGSPPTSSRRSSDLTVRSLSVLCLVLLPSGVWGFFLASDASDRYHRPSCRVVSRIDPVKRIRFETKDAAWKRGYRPCEICRPEGFDRPLPKRSKGSAP